MSKKKLESRLKAKNKGRIAEDRIDNNSPDIEGAPASGGNSRKFLSLFENVGDTAALEATKKVKDERYYLQRRQDLILHVRCYNSP